ncbi:MAG: hypothetical protein M9888_07225 [Chitinophagales bacterium]|nr:hypothetical protein [Chitinophagales bacterium]
MNIYIANLPNNASEQDIRELFARFGRVQSVKIILDKETQKSRNFGFVIMNNEQEANLAISGLNGFNLSGKSLAVSEAKPKDSSVRGNSMSREFTNRNPQGANRNSDRPQANGFKPNNGSSSYTPRPANIDFTSPSDLLDSNKSKRDKEVKKDKPEKNHFDTEKRIKKEVKSSKKYNRLDDDDDDTFGYKIGKY